MGNNPNISESNSSNIVNVVWVDPNVDNEENTTYLNDLKTIENTRISCFKNVNDALIFIKTLKFCETKIIISGKLYSNFIEKFEENLTDIYIIPKIVIFTSDIEKFINNNKNYNGIYNSFYNLGGIKTSYEDIKNFLLKPLEKPINEKDTNEENQLTFEYIDCKEKLVLPLLYKSLIELTSIDNIEKYTEYLYDEYSSNEEINKLFESIKYIKDIPIELVSKYYARLYTIESQFYNDINKGLRENKKDKYLSYIRILYEGIKLKSLPLASNNILYRGSKISNEELILIKNYLNNKIQDLPGAIVFSKSFLSFTKDKNIAENYLNKNINNNNNLSKVLYIIEKDNNMDYSLSTHSDIENISLYPNEKEILFFPFSSFEIKEINENIINHEKIYEITLIYLGKYIKDIENIDKNVPDSKFKNELIKLGLIPEKKMEKTKEIINQYKEFKYNIINNIKNKVEKKEEEKENDKDKKYDNEKEKEKQKEIEENKEEKEEIENNEKCEENVKENEKKKKETEEYEKEEEVEKKKNIVQNSNENKDEEKNQEKEIEKFDKIIEKNNIEDKDNEKEKVIKNENINEKEKDIKKTKIETNLKCPLNEINKMKNEITMKIEISEWDVNKKIYFLGNDSDYSKITKFRDNFRDYFIKHWLDDYDSEYYDSEYYEVDEDRDEIEVCHDNLKELNELNVELYINNIKNEYKKYFIPEKEGIYTIKLTFNIYIKDCSFMFYNCTNLIDIDLSSFNISNVKDMSFMFYNCHRIKSISDISKWDTKNVNNMSGMFARCKSIPDISKWDTKNVNNIWGIFGGFESIPSISEWSDNNNLTDTPSGIRPLIIEI